MSDMNEQVENKERGDKVYNRRFKRYNRARERQLASDKADEAFFKAVFSLAAVGTAIVFVLVFAVMSGGRGLAAFAPMSAPWLGPFSQLEIIGFGMVALLAGVYLWRIRKK